MDKKLPLLFIFSAALVMEAMLLINVVAKPVKNKQALLDYLDNMSHSPHMFRMRKLIFLELCDILETKYNLKKTRNVSIYEQVGLFLYMLSQPGVYIGRKGYTITNVMAVCDFSLCFTFVWAGWEGSAHDTKIFMEALCKPALHFPHPPQGKYYLVDSSYPTFMDLLGPYKKTRYHLPQFRIRPRIRGRVEVFNYYHFSLRSTIECAFGLCKTR
ncbi:hypothetical protein D0Y65_005827 [Glycine soja]|uniref:Uncharacterized protein n=1 Tax=Glycine soja TaxID=3848 RepID=A0A445L6H6_GLYSO|nr:hypothetical protein D0Y65_005827 [Glycine soja]